MMLRKMHLWAIDMLASTHLSYRDIAYRVRVHPRTLSRWVKDPDFRSELDRRREVPPYNLINMRKWITRMILGKIARQLLAGDEALSLKDASQLLARLSDESYTRLSKKIFEQEYILTEMDLSDEDEEDEEDDSSGENSTP